MTNSEQDTDDETEDTKFRGTGRLGELEVEMQLLLNGWYPVRLDTASMAANADLLAVNRHQRVGIQVKATNTHIPNSHAQSLGFGYSTSYLQEKKTVFNSKKSPLIADVVVGVGYYPNRSRFVVMPVAFAESLCRLHCDYWYAVPTRTESGKRKDTFPIYVNFTEEERGTHTEHHAQCRRNLLHYENAWHILSEPLEKLHDPSAWPLFD